MRNPDPHRQIKIYGKKSWLEIVFRAIGRMFTFRKGWIVSDYISFFDRKDLRRL